jgi:hypothetical protein
MTKGPKRCKRSLHMLHGPIVFALRPHKHTWSPILKDRSNNDESKPCLSRTLTALYAITLA